MLRELIAERSKIADCMTWCIDHAEAADEVINNFINNYLKLNTMFSERLVFTATQA